MGRGRLVSRTLLAPGAAVLEDIQHCLYHPKTLAGLISCSSPIYMCNWSDAENLDDWKFAGAKAKNWILAINIQHYGEVLK